MEYSGNRRIASSATDGAFELTSAARQGSHCVSTHKSGDTAESGFAQVPAAIGAGVEEFFLVTRMLLVRGEQLLC